MEIHPEGVCVETVTELFINYWKSNVNNFHVRKI